MTEAKSIDEVKDIRDKAEATRAYARQANNRAPEVDAAEIRMRAQRQARAFELAIDRFLDLDDDTDWRLIHGSILRAGAGAIVCRRTQISLAMTGSARSSGSGLSAGAFAIPFTSARTTRALMESSITSPITGGRRGDVHASSAARSPLFKISTTR
ncbi:MAG TPA: hypothetical protein VI113_06825 [Alphaproteobacteria bacterium]